MTQPKDLTGQKFGELTAIKYAYSKNNSRYWLCLCTCGKEKIARTADLIAGKTKSCGCLQFKTRQNTGLQSKKHGMTNSRIYNIWRRMRYRCYSNRDEHYKNYGQRGVAVCKEWLNDFSNFYNWAISNGYKDNLTIDRIDVNGNYEPLNCRWVDMKVQSNNKRNNHYISFNNEIHTISQWADLHNIRETTLCERLKRGWSMEEALTTPTRKYK